LLDRSIENGLQTVSPMSERPLLAEEQIALRILEYLKEHPQAKDTIEGISLWWLELEAGRYRLADIAAALSLLLSRNLIVSTQLKGSPRCYAVNPRKLDEIDRILKL
jgi:hypothetical protein